MPRFLLLLACCCSLLVQAAGKEIHIGIEPFFTPRLLVSSFQPMRDAMEKQLGRPVVLLTAPDYRQFVRRIEQHEFDLVIIGPHTARYAELHAGYLPALIGRTRLSGLVVVPRGGEALQISDLNKQTIALPDALTVTAMLGEAWLKKQGLQVHTRYYAFHNAAAIALLQGDARAAIINKTAFANLPVDIRSALRVVGETQSLPHMVVLADAKLAPAERKRYIDSLAGFVNSRENGDSFAARLGFSGLDPVKPGELAIMEPFVTELQRRLDTE
ncbi:phosphate/phosphite/phosphonate ABC transporter substrate-binding protein [Chitinimonas sp. BJYL2]|uniref:phosphate/phosphite/phosphonate ABC transporter substrate-binding protein n=1 Tax=Chitinimonas sp. BJYL2 TaxID=2976696 RepID=UPI0022B33DF5|nr:PhnD/SsuA/transferrin family substrate-binding protein [Chitinimonas sp. BJYL2]